MKVSEIRKYLGKSVIIETLGVKHLAIIQEVVGKNIGTNEDWFWAPKIISITEYMPKGE